MIGLALLMSAIVAPQAIRTDCSMGECRWLSGGRRAVLLHNRDGQLVRYTAMEGRSRHPDDKYPRAYSSRMHVRFSEKTYYAFCSHSRPAVAFRAEVGPRRGKWLAHLLNFHDLYGYNHASAVTYFAACHAVDLNYRPLRAVLRRLGYDRATPSAQIELGAPVDIADPKFVARALKQSGEDVGSGR